MDKEHLFHSDRTKDIRVTGRLDSQQAIPGDSKWIADFLSDLSREYEKKEFNEEYLFDRIVKYFKRDRKRFVDQST